MVIAVTPKAEMEPGFEHWFLRISTIAKTGGMSLHFFADSNTIGELKKLNINSLSPVVATYTIFNKWEDFLILGRELKQNDFFVIVSSRKVQISYMPELEKLPYYLSRYFTNNSFIIIYPKQLIAQSKPESEPENYLLEAFADRVQVVNKEVGKAGSFISKLLRRRN